MNRGPEGDGGEQRLTPPGPGQEPAQSPPNRLPGRRILLGEDGIDHRPKAPGSTQVVAITPRMSAIFARAVVGHHRLLVIGYRFREKKNG